MTTTTTDRPTDYGMLTSRFADLVRTMDGGDCKEICKAAAKLGGTARIGLSAEEAKQMSLELIREAAEEE